MASTVAESSPPESSTMTCMAGIYCILLHLPMPAKNDFLRTDEEAGGREAFADAALYDSSTAAAALTSTSTGAWPRTAGVRAGWPHPGSRLRNGTAAAALAARRAHGARAGSLGVHAGCGSAPGRPPACHPPCALPASCGRTCAPLPCSRASLWRWPPPQRAAPVC